MQVSWLVKVLKDDMIDFHRYGQDRAFKRLQDIFLHQEFSLAEALYIVYVRTWQCARECTVTRAQTGNCSKLEGRGLI